jgi:putative peptide-modifying radical SAM enzyme
MFYHLFLTTSCNLTCRYCCEEALEESAPFPFRVDLCLPEKFSKLEVLRRFLRSDPDPTLIFYGGEPLLALDELRWLMDHIEARFIMQTNGTLLHLVNRRYLSRFHTILVSIDGRERTTDYFRGEGTFRRVMENLKSLEGFRGELIARMTVMEPLDIFEEVRWLASNEEFPFRSIHWQLNAGFWNDFGRREFRTWLERSYLPGLKKLAEWWVNWMEEKGEVLKLYPFLGVTKSLLEGEPFLDEVWGGTFQLCYPNRRSNHTVPSHVGHERLLLGLNRDLLPARTTKGSFPLEPVQTAKCCGFAAVDASTQLLPRNGVPPIPWFVRQ